jgi:hypothetical protein
VLAESELRRSELSTLAIDGVIQQESFSPT